MWFNAIIFITQLMTFMLFMLFVEMLWICLKCLSIGNVVEMAITYLRGFSHFFLQNCFLVYILKSTLYFIMHFFKLIALRAKNFVL